MALPAGSDILGLDFVNWSLPFVNVDKNISTDSRTLEFVNWSLPLVTAPSGTVAVAPTSNVYAKVSGNWINATEVWVNVSGTWRQAENNNIYYKDNGLWKL